VFRDKITVLLPFVKKVFYEHDISKLDFDINKTQINILMFISENNEKSMSEISLMTGLEKSSFTRSVDSLVENGFITKNLPENDRRKIMLSLTEKGIKTAKFIKNDFDVYLESLISDFTEQEKDDFFKSLTAVSKYMNKILESKKK